MEPGCVAAGTVGALAPPPGGRGWAVDVGVALGNYLAGTMELH